MEERKNNVEPAQDVMAEENFPGAAVDRADKEKVDDCLQKQETRMLNNNPRNTDGPAD